MAGLFALGVLVGIAVWMVLFLIVALLAPTQWLAMACSP